MIYAKRKPNGKYYWGNNRLQMGDYLPGEAYLSRSQKRLLCAAYAAGEMTALEIAIEFNCTPRTVLRIARERGLPPKTTRKNLSPEALRRAAELWRSDEVSRKQIASMLGVNSNWVRYALESRGIKVGRKPRAKRSSR